MSFLSVGAQHPTLNCGTVEVYCDVTVTPGRCAGCAVAWVNRRGTWSLLGLSSPPHTTPVQAELVGILQAAKSTRSRMKNPERHIRVLTDCKRAIDRLTTSPGNRHSVCDLTQLVTRRLSNLKATLELVYIPSKGSVGNLQVRPASTSYSRHPGNGHVPLAANGWLHGRCDAAFDSEVQSLGRSFRGVWKVVSGRNVLRYSRKKVDGGSGVCPYCDSGEEEDFLHFLFDCPHWQQYRNELQRMIQLREIAWPPSSGDVLLRDKPLAAALERYIYLTKRLGAACIEKKKKKELANEQEALALAKSSK
ncbi:hypothetical protein FOZ63_002938, partial [Perkinsus olseni]